MGKRQVRKQLNIFIKRVKKELKPEKIILYGSYAIDEANKYSDIDILVISKNFKHKDEENRAKQLYQLTKDLYPDFHVYGFFPEEIKKVSEVTTLYQALKTGVIIS